MPGLNRAWLRHRLLVLLAVSLNIFAEAVSSEVHNEDYREEEC